MMLETPKWVDIIRTDMDDMPGVFHTSLIAQNPVPQYVMAWITRHTVELGTFRVCELRAGEYDYEILCPGGQRKLLRKPGTSKIKQYLKNIANNS